MSTFIQMPLSLNQLKTKSNFLEIYTYFLIRSQIKDNKYTASIAETELADKIGVSDLTIKRYIKDLNPYFDNVTKTKTTGDHYYNVYHFTYLSKDYSIVLPSLIDNDDLTPEQKGILIKIKMMCEKGTNFIKYNSKAELVKIIGIGKNQINGKLQPLIDKGYLCYIGKSLHLSSNYFPLFLNNDAIENYVYKVIYNYCIINKVCPPLRDTKAIGWIAAKYANTTDSDGKPNNDLLIDLTKRCAKLPKDVSLDYFIKALENKDINRIKQTFTFTV